MSAGAVAVELGTSRLRAVEAVPTRHGVRVVRSLVDDIPAHLDQAEPEEVGRWIGEELAKAGFRGNKCIVALPREDVVLKRLIHPTTEVDELPDMTRLSIERDLPFEGDDAVIDFVVLESEENSTTVLAAALPGETLARTRSMMAAAGLIIQGISLRTFGAATIVESVAGPETDVVAIDLIPGDGIEFTFTRNGRIRFSRAARLVEVDEESLVGAAVREAQRTWLSRQMDDDQAGVDAGVVLGPGGLADRVAGRVGSLLKTPIELLDSHQWIESRDQPLDRHWSLVGLLLARVKNKDMIDFAAPRKSPDPLAGRRKVALGAAALLLLLILGVWTIGNLSTRGLRNQIAALQERRSALEPEFFRYHRDRFRVGHLDLWESADVDWISHLQHLDSLRPPAEDLVLDEVTGTLDFDGVTRDRRNKKDWSANWSIGLTINGESRDRTIADALREQLVEAMTYTTSSAGNDTAGGRRLPNGFTYQLRSVIADPDRKAREEEAGS